jgi:hypothetical protein
MSDSNSADSSAARVTLKLKAGARKSPDQPKVQLASRPQSKASEKSGAHWSDEYKDRMQADMDALAGR